MTKKPFKVFSKTALAAVLASSALVPTAVFAAEPTATSLSLTKVVVEKEGVPYSIDLDTYILMDDAKVPFLTGVQIEFVTSSNGKTYKVEDYLIALDASGNKELDAFELLDANASFEQDVDSGSVEVGSNGEVVVTEPSKAGDFAVTDISAINKTGFTVTTDATPSEAPTAAQFNITVGGVSVPATAVTAVASDGTGKTFVVSVDLDDKKGALVVNTKSAGDINFSIPKVEVESVTSINNNGVTVKFPALTNDFNGATVTVKDPAGNQVAVVAQNLTQGATTATFPFTAAQTSLAAGTWTVDGKEVLVKSQDAGLQNLVTDAGIWSEDFAINKLTSLYTVNVKNDVSRINLTPTAVDGAVITALITRAGQTSTQVLNNNTTNAIDLAAATMNDSTTTVGITVVAPNQTTSKTYSVEIKRPAANASNDAYATALGYGAVLTSVIGFDEKNYTYSANVAAGVSNLPIVVDADSNASVYVNGILATNSSGTFTSPVDLAYGKNSVAVKVVAQDGSTSQTYNIEVNRAVVGGSIDIKLNSVTLSQGTLAGFTASSIASQTLTTLVPNEASEITVTPVANDAKSTVVVSKDTSNTNTNLTVEKQGASYVIKNLSTTTNNIVQIKVISENGDVQDSTLTINRAAVTASDVANLTDLNIAGLTTAEFVSTTTSYNRNVLTRTTTVGAITGTASANALVTYEVNGVNFGTDTGIVATLLSANQAAEDASLKIGANVVKITVSSPDAKNSRTYTININRADVGASTVDTLKSLTTNTGTVSNFVADDSSTGTVKVNVSNASSEVTLTPTTTNAKATVEVRAAKNSATGVISTAATDKLEVVKNANGSFTIKGLQVLDTSASTTNVAEIVVTAEDATTETYIVDIDRAEVSASDAASITTLQQHNAPTAFPTSSGTPYNESLVAFTGTTGEVTIKDTQNTIYFKPVLATGAVATVDGKSLDTNGVSAPVTVAVGQTKAVVIKVTAANGVTIKEYTVNVKRAVENASTINTLSAFTLSAGQLNGFVTNDGSKTSLTTTVPTTASDLTITPTATNAGSTISVKASKGNTYNSATPLVVEKTGANFTIKGLQGGAAANTVVVTVTSASGVTKDYTLVATRAIEGVSTDSTLDDADLAIVSSTGSTPGTAIDETTVTSPFDFKGATKDYTVYVANTVDEVEFTATEKVEGQTFTAKVNGVSKPVTIAPTTGTIAVPLVKGQNNKVEITVTAPDASTATTYTVNVASAASSASTVNTLDTTTPFTNVSPAVTIGVAAGTDTYATSTLDNNIATFKFKPAFTNAGARAVVSITNAGKTKYYTPDANGIYTVDVADTGTTAVKVLVVAGDNATNKEYTLNLVKTP